VEGLIIDISQVKREVVAVLEAVSGVRCAQKWFDSFCSIGVRIRPPKEKKTRKILRDEIYVIYEE
jgi:hypothetical protein